MIDVLAGACLILGSLLALVAGIGLVRFPDVLTRMHAATKPQTLGILLVLLGLALRVEDRRALTVIALAGVFQLVTAPVSAHMLGRAALRAGHIDRTRLTRDDLVEHDRRAASSDPETDPGTDRGTGRSTR